MKEVYIKGNDLPYTLSSILSGMLLLIGIIIIINSLIEGKIIYTFYGIVMILFAYWIAPSGENTKRLMKKRKNSLDKIEFSFFENKLKDSSVSYISVFSQSISGHARNSRITSIVYDVNVWFEDNKHETLYRTDDKKLALGAGYKLANKMKIDCLDATNGADREWMDLNKPLIYYLNE